MTNREPLILLVHRVPYPPNKGDKIRSYHLLRHLAGRYAVHLGAFADDPDDLAHGATLRQWCAEVHLEPLGPLRSRMRMLPALLSGGALSVAAYRSATMRRWVERTARATAATRFVAFSAAMAQYADALPSGGRRVLDMVDVDSDKWRQYGQRRRGPAGWLYRREARCLLRQERAAAAAHEAVTLVSPAEAALFARLDPPSSDRVFAVGNGVDCGYFDPDVAHENPYPPGVRPLVFTGAMDYWPNADAVTWFADEVLPSIRARVPDAVLHVVGARPGPALRALGQRPGLAVIGAVPDVRPWLAHAELVVAPLRVARGIQNKVLEGFAMARPVLATPMALEGLELGADYPLCAESAAELARLAAEVLQSAGADAVGRGMRAWVQDHHDWQRRLAPLAELLEVAAPEAGGASPRVAAG